MVTGLGERVSRFRVTQALSRARVRPHLHWRVAVAEIPGLSGRNGPSGTHHERYFIADVDIHAGEKGGVHSRRRCVAAVTFDDVHDREIVGHVSLAIGDLQDLAIPSRLNVGAVDACSTRSLPIAKSPFE